MTFISARDSAYDFIVKFSPSVCVAVESWREKLKMAAQSFTYHAHGTADSEKFMVCVPWQNINSALLARTPPTPTPYDIKIK